MKKKKIITLIISILVLMGMGAGLYFLLNQIEKEEEIIMVQADDDFILIQGGEFSMGSPESERQRELDEVLHTVTVQDFYTSMYEVTQKEYESIMGTNPSEFIGENLPVENITWYEAVQYCNLLSQQEGLELAYEINGTEVVWNKGANGYRLPTEAEWEYMARAGTTTPFNTETSISPEESNYYGHYPYLIEENYFTQEELDTKPGQYRQTTVEVNSFSPNKWGLYNIHGNVREWCFDYYGEYDVELSENPSGPSEGIRKIVRGGGWNDYAKHMRSAYRSSMEPDKKMNNTGFRVVRNASSGESETVHSNSSNQVEIPDDANILIAYFSWGGNTRGVARTIANKIDADLFEIELVQPYSSNYNRVLDQAQSDLNNHVRPEIRNKVEDIDSYDVIMIGYPNWWATIPMPIASFLEEYDLSGKILLPFCSHGGGSFGQSLTDITKLSPDSIMGEALSIHYSGGSSLSNDVSNWLAVNGIEEN